MQFNIYKMIKKDERGFTLIEVIVSLVVAAILGTMLVSFMGTSVMKSANPVILMQNGAYLNSIMENMSADYKYQMFTAASYSTPTAGLSAFISNVGTEGSMQYYYSPDTSHLYTVVANHRVSIPISSPYTETADISGKILKVTINYNNLTATALFTE